MFKLIRLEWKKNRIGKYIRNALILTAVLLLMLLSVAGELESDEVKYAYGGDMLKAGVEMFTNLSFIIFSSVMLAAFIVGTYREKTINLMFSYPISRRLILGSQMAAVWIFNFTALVLSKIAIYAVLTAVKSFTYITAESIALGDGMFYAEILVDSAVMISISFVALPVGMLLKSSKAAIIAGVVIVCFTQGNIGSYTLLGNIPFYMILVIISVVSVFLALYGVETRDV